MAFKFNPNLDQMNTLGLNDPLNFGQYKGTLISDIVQWNAKYIIDMYDLGALKPDQELLKLIHKTREDITISDEEDEWNALFGHSHKGYNYE